MNNRIYSRDEVFSTTLEYFGGDELAASTWVDKYALKTGEGAYAERSPDDMHRRMAREFARIESLYESREKKAPPDRLSGYGKRRSRLDEEKIHRFFEKFRFLIPQGSVMYGLGNPSAFVSLSNCVVLPEIHDSYGGILHTDQQLVQLFKRRCGAGIDISSLRPSGLPVFNAARTTSGAVSFMERFSATTREVAQNGRRGALMITLDIAHPDIERFVTAKQDLLKVTGANISIRLTDEFMQAVEQGRDFLLRWPVDSTSPSVKRPIPARDLWDTIIRCAHQTGEPGLIFWDRQHRYSTSSLYPGFRNVSTNPCSEIAMQGGDSCRLMALNLYSFVENPFTPLASFRYEAFYEAAYEAQRLMDDLVDLELEAIERILLKVRQDPEPEHIRSVEVQTWELLYENGRKGRRTGLGFTALADTLAALGMPFDGEDSLSLIDQIMKTKCRAEFDSSIDMAIGRGAFEGFDPRVEEQSEFVSMLKEELPDLYRRMMQHGRRNISISTVAPTGSISLLARCSSGIEPVFMLAYKRRKKISNTPAARVDFVDALGDSWEEFAVYHPKLEDWMRVSGQSDPAASPYAGSTASEIDWLRRLEVQAIVQKYTTHSISSTLNLPSSVEPERVGEIYLEAWRRGLKGITVYRDGARSGVLVAARQEKPVDAEFPETTAPPRPATLEADIIRFYNGTEKWIAFVGLLHRRPYEIFTGRVEDSLSVPEYVRHGWILKVPAGEGKRYDFRYTGSNGRPVTIEGLSNCFSPEFWNYAKLISGVLRHGMPLPLVVDLVSNLHLYNDSINTWKNGVERALKRFIPDGTSAPDKICPDCGDPAGLYYEEGCLKCRSCTFSRCG
jgi:ribonucleoside-diphosphate reductase alpha chain